jgi:biopolymer transport protein ExbD
MKKKSLFLQQERSAPKLNITSLMDVLTIILIFLLVNYSDQPEERDLPKFISLPKITGEIDTQKTNPVSISIGLNKISIGKDFQFEYQNIDKDIEIIKNKLETYLKSLDQKSPEGKTVKDASLSTKAKKVTVYADKKIRFEILSQIIATFSDNGYGTIDFINLTQQQ